MGFIEPRRSGPRITLDGLCGVVTQHAFRHAALVDLSSMGLRLERPFDPATASRAVQLELELPGVDEIVWARGEVTFAHLSPMGGTHPDGQPRLWCRAGIQITAAAGRDLNRLRDYVYEARRVRVSTELGLDEAPARLRGRARWSRRARRAGALTATSAVLGAGRPLQVPR